MNESFIIGAEYIYRGGVLSWEGAHLRLIGRSGETAHVLVLEEFGGYHKGYELTCSTRFLVLAPCGFCAVCEEYKVIEGDYLCFKCRQVTEENWALCNYVRDLDGV